MSLSAFSFKSINQTYFKMYSSEFIFRNGYNPLVLEKNIETNGNLFLGQQHSGHGKRKIPQHISGDQGDYIF